jgi:hypothetical protein
LSTNFTQLRVLAQKPGIDGKAVAATLIGTTENGTRRFYPTAVLYELTAVAVLIGVCTASVGTNGAAYNDVMAAGALTGLSAVNGMLRVSVALATSIAPNTGVYVNITAGATATTYTLRAAIEGYYI